MEEIACIGKSKALEILVIGISSELEAEGFKYSKSKVAFIRKTNFGFQQISLIGFSYWPAYIGISIIYSVRFDELENLRSKFIDVRFGNFSKADIRGWRSAWCQPNFEKEPLKFKKPHLERYHAYDEDGRFAIEWEEDVEAIIPNFINSIRKTAFPFFELHQGVESIVEDKKKEFIEEYKYNPVAAAYIHILIVLWLCKDAEFKHYRELTLNRIKQDKIKFKDDVSRLEKIQAVYDCIAYLDKERQ